MNENGLTDIKEVCDKYNITSRTLRFYEEEGLIESTREVDSNRRKYTSEQISQVRQILTLRAIGISVKKIKEYLKGNVSLTEIVCLRKAEITASIETKMREIRMLNKTLMAIEDGENVFDEDMKSKRSSISELTEIARKCTGYMIYGELDKIYPYFSKTMTEYMPIDSFKAMWRDSIAGIGDFMRMGETTVSDESDDIVFQEIVFANAKMQIKFVFRNKTIHGLWQSYIE